MATITVGPSGRDYTSLRLAILAADDNPTSRANRTLILVDYAIYTETLDFQSLSGGWQIPCIVRAADPNNRPIIQSNGASQACLGGGAYRGTAVGETELDGLIFSGWTNASNGVLYFSIAGLVIKRCKFTGNTGRTCVRWCGSSASRYGITDSCEIDTSGSTGSGAKGAILAYGTAAVVANNKAVLPANVQFLFEPTSGPGYVEHNSLLVDLTTSSTAAIYMVGACRGNLIKNLGSGHYGIYNWGGTNTENWVNGTFSSRFTGTDGGSNVDTDPLFANTGTGDLTLQSGSPASRSIARSVNTPLDILGVSRSDPTDPGAYEMSGDASISAATALTATTIELTIDDLVANDSTWTDAGNYTVTPSGGAYPVEVVSAVVGDDDESIILTTAEHTDGGAYTVAWAGLANIVDGSQAYTGIGVAPEVSGIVVRSENLIRVTFNEAMDGADPDLVDPANYVLSGGDGPRPAVTAVTKGPGTNPTYVDLTVAGGLRNRRYTLTVKA